MKNILLAYAKNKGSDQIPGNCTADQRLCFSLNIFYNPFTSNIQNCKPAAIFCGCKARFVLELDLVGNQENRPSSIINIMNQICHIYVKINHLIFIIQMLLSFKAVICPKCFIANWIFGIINLHTPLQALGC